MDQLCLIKAEQGAGHSSSMIFYEMNGQAEFFRRLLGADPFYRSFFIISFFFKEHIAVIAADIIVDTNKLKQIFSYDLFIG